MKKMTALLLLLGLMLTLCACGQTAGEPAAEAAPAAGTAETETTPEATEEDILAASMANAAQAALVTPPASGSDISTNEDLMRQAEEFIGLSAAEMFAAIGEPTSVEYAASCEDEDTDDGMLYYPGFYVWTMRQGFTETVRAVYPEE